MKFLEKINGLKCKYDKCVCDMKDNAFLYDLLTPSPPLATHIVFAPMPKEVMNNMICNYKLSFPNELLELYNYMNGADLFWTSCEIGKSNRRIPISRLSIYGIPLTDDRKHLEPFNISIEDLGRPKGTPKSWLKFGSFYYPEDLFKRKMLFVDVDSLKVFAVDENEVECSIVENWNSIDECLCYVFDLLDSCS